MAILRYGKPRNPPEVDFGLRSVAYFISGPE